MANDRTPIESKGVLASLMLFLALSFARLFAQPDRIHRLSAEAWSEGLMLPAPWWPDFLSGLIPDTSTHIRIVAALTLALVVGLQFLMFSMATDRGNSESPRAMRMWQVAHSLFCAAFMWRVFQYGSSVSEFEVYDHVFGILAFAYLLGGRFQIERIWFALAGVYFLSALAKLNPSWLSGRIFTTTQEMLAFLPEVAWIVQLACLLLVFIEFVVPGFFFSISERRRRWAWWTFIGFHAYSFFLIDYRFPGLMLTFLMAVGLSGLGKFPDRDRLIQSFKWTSSGRAETLKTWSVAGLILGMIGSSLISTLNPGARVLTMQGRSAGLFMFDVNTNCRVSLQLRRQISQAEESFQIIHTSGYRENMRLADGGSEPKSRDRIEISLNSQRIRLDANAYGNIYAGLNPSSGNRNLLYNRGLICSDSRRVCCDPQVYAHFLSRQLQQGKWDEVGLKIEADLNGWQKWWTVVDLNNIRSLDQLKFEFSNPPEDYPAEYRWP
ncbi:MAG TPA: hypothetical protein PLZ57_13645 [Pseudobdellovibrionaceae bacterium]|nr:hypothetical protein [Pseudobdellovibrionaceae bacterium]